GFRPAVVFRDGAAALQCLSADGRILRANRAMLELLGLSAEDYLGRDFAEFCAEPAEAAELKARLARGETLAGWRILLRRGDGGTRRLRLASTPNGSIGAIVHAQTLAPEPEPAPGASESSRREAELEAVINRTPFMLIRCSRDLRYCLVSETYAQMFGRKAEDLVGKKIV